MTTRCILKVFPDGRIMAMDVNPKSREPVILDEWFGRTKAQWDACMDVHGFKMVRTERPDPRIPFCSTVYHYA